MAKNVVIHWVVDFDSTEIREIIIKGYDDIITRYDIENNKIKAFEKLNEILIKNSRTFRKIKMLRI